MIDPAVGVAPGAYVRIDMVNETVVRVRRPLDLLRLAALALLLATIAAFGSGARNTTRGANQDLTRLDLDVPHTLVHALSLLGSLGVLGLPIVLVAREILRGQRRRLVEAIATGIAAIGVVGIGDVLISSDRSSALQASMTQVARGTTGRPLDAYIAALFALVLVIGVANEPGWRAAFWSVSGIYVVSAFIALQASALSLIASPALGAAVGVAVRFAAGSVNERPGPRRVVEELARAGFQIVELTRVSLPGEPYRQYLARTASGRALTVQVFDRDLLATGAIYSIYRRLRLRSSVLAAPALSLERVAERRSVLAYTAMAADVHTPRYLAGVPCGPDSVVLVYESIPGTRLSTLTDSQLTDLWQNVEKLHRARMTHRGLTAENVLVDPAGRVVLPVPTDGAVFASDLRISLDRAQLLITTAQLVGADRAVQVARAVIEDSALAATVALLQPIALPNQTRTALKKNPHLLESVRDQIHGQTHYEAPEPTRVERFRPRVIVSIAALIVAVYLLVVQLTSVDLVTVFSTAHWGWVPFVLLASVGTYLSAALSLTGYVRERLSFPRTVLVQVAASFVGFVTPPAVGGLAINLRYLRSSRLSATAAATSVAMLQVINAITHILLLIVFATATGVSSARSLPLPSWVFGAVGVLTGLVLILLSLPRPRHWALSRLVPPLQEAGPRLVDLVSSPSKLLEALSGALLLNGCYISALWFAVRAFGSSLDLAAVAVIYLAGAAVASVAPTPGGLGAVEIALATGLAAAGVPSAAAVSAVLLYRISTFWLPVPAGWAAFQYLQRRGAV